MSDFSILIVDDEPEIRSGLTLLLETAGYSVQSAEDGRVALQLCKDRPPSLILSDIMMPGMTGIELLKQVKAINSEIIVVLFTGYSSIENAVEAIKHGAEEYLIKPVIHDEVLTMVKRIQKRVELKRRNEILQQEIQRRKTVDIIGKSEGIKRVKKDIAQVAQSDITVLILGETGTGKELVARSIHDQSTRSSEPFVAINCAAIPSDLLESELFGHEKGAFSGAIVRKYGLFEVANKGTIFLDEIGEMTPDLQPKILRTIETKKFRRLGAQKEISSDFRVISSTNRDLKQLVASGTFREDLYYRLSPYSIEVPPLRKRLSDIPLLVNYFGVKKGRKETVSDANEEFIKVLQSYHWPGNVRELQNTMERVFLLAGDGASNMQYLPAEILQSFDRQKAVDRDDSEIQTLADIEKEYILEAFNKLGGNKTLVAKALGISLRTLYNKLERFNIEDFSLVMKDK